MKYYRYNYCLPVDAHMSDFIDIYDKKNGYEFYASLDVNSEDACDAAVFAEAFPAQERYPV